MEPELCSELAVKIVDEIGTVVVGQTQAVQEMVIALLAGGHALLEGVPGTAKTLMARLLAIATGASFRRIQFTPDLMPSDIVGVNVFNLAGGEFVFRPGPIFTDILLADEINRAPAKTQSALLEAMQEKQATVDGKPYPVSGIFTVFATQNPVEFEGTYPLPEAEVDRFMLKILVGYPDESSEERILDKVMGGFDPSSPFSSGVGAILDASKLEELRKCVRSVHVEEKVCRYITRVVRATRSIPQVALGASPRATVMLMQASQAAAVLAGRAFVTPDDVKSVALPVLRHRILLHPEAEVEGRSSDDCVRELMLGIEVPR
jgi:MoxR-like ATPase